jgi:hypothetical protein
MSQMLGQIYKKKFNYFIDTYHGQKRCTKKKEKYPFKFAVILEIISKDRIQKGFCFAH